MSVQPVRCMLFIPPDPFDDSDASSDRTITLSNAMPISQSVSATVAAPAAAMETSGEAVVSSIEPTVDDRLGGRIAAIQYDGRLRLFLCNNGQLVDSVFEQQGLDGDQTGPSSLVAGNLSLKCHALSRVAAARLGTSQTVVVYQNLNGDIAQHVFDEGIQDWSPEEVLVQANCEEAPLPGTTLAIYETQNSLVLLWQSIKGALVRKILNGDEAMHPIQGIDVLEGADVRVARTTGNDKNVSVYWIDRNMANVRNASGPAVAYETTFQEGREFKLAHTPGALAVFELSASSDKSDGLIYYVSNPRSRCVEYMDGEVTGLIGPSSSRISSRMGLTLVIRTMREQEDGKSVMLLYQDSVSSHLVLLIRDVLDIDDDQTRVVQLAGGTPGPDTTPSQPSDRQAPGSDSTAKPSKINGSGNANGSGGSKQVTAPVNVTKTNGVDRKPENGINGSKQSAVDVTGWIYKTCKDVLTKRLTTAVQDGSRVATKNLGAVMAARDGFIKPGDTVYAPRDKLWEECPAKIYYAFLPGTHEGSTAQKKKVRDSIVEWTYYVNIEFIEAEPDSADVKILFDPNDGSWSYVGLDCRDVAAGLPTMNLAWVQASGVTPTKNEKAVILHEFGHVLGLLHEHQSPAHGAIAVIDEQAALNMYRTGQNWPDKQIYDQVINVYKSSDVSNYSQVDEFSIMHYPQPKQLTGLDHDIGYNVKLSDLDKAYMVLQYPRATPHEKVPEWTFEHALDIIACPSSVRNAILQAKKKDVDGKGNIDPSNIRTLLGDWAKGAHAKKGAQAAHGVAGPVGDQPSETTPSQPLHGVFGPDTDDEKADFKRQKERDAAYEGPFIKVLYSKLLNFFPPGDGQYFALQFPTRYLDKTSFAYDTSNIFSQFEKPVVVNEAEFRLTDSLYPLGPIVGGPNGQSLASNYSKLINSLIPGYEGSRAREQREKMRSWLLTETHEDDSSMIVDSRLAVPKLSSAERAALSKNSNVSIIGSNDEPGQDGTDTNASNTDNLSAAKKALLGVEGSGFTEARLMSRMEFSSALNLEYLNAKQTWDLKKDHDMREAEAKNDLKEMEKLTRTLAHTSATQNAILSDKWANAVVRGHVHTVRELLGHLDVRTPAELLQDAKDSFRESALGSLFTASNIYPVQMQPADWFQALDTGFTREDLSQAPEIMEEAIHAKSMQIDLLETQMASLRGFQAGNPKDAQKLVDDAVKDRDNAMAELSSKYTESTISAVKLAITAVQMSTPAGAAWAVLQKGIEGDKQQTSKLQGVLGSDYAKLDDIGKQITAVTDANVKVNQSSRRLTELMSASALASAGDTKIQVENIQRSLTAARKELQELSESYAIAMKATKERKAATEVSVDDIGKIPPGNGGSRWIDLNVHSSVSTASNTTSSESSAKTSSYHCNFWIGSYAHDDSEAKSENAAEADKKNVTVDVSMRVTYVTVDRSGWFDPSIAEMSGAFMHPDRAEKASTWSDWTPIKDDTNKAATEAAKDPSKVKKSQATLLAEQMVMGNTDYVQGYLGAYPVGYILVKDCVIQVTSAELHDEQARKSFQATSDSSGGFLCFSHSSSSKTTSESSSSKSLEAKDGMVIRIPGPQILGYMMQLMPPDKSAPFEEMPKDYLFEDMKRIDEEDQKRKKPAQPAHAASFAGVDVANKSANKPMGIRRYRANGMFSQSNTKTTADNDKPKTGPVKAASMNPAAAAGQDEEKLGHFAETLYKALGNLPGMSGKTSAEVEDFAGQLMGLLDKAVTQNKPASA